MKRIALVVMLAVALPALAAPVADSSRDGVRITLTDEPCAIPAVANLPGRATWTEKGKTFEGCFAVHPMGLVMLFFGEDRSVVVVPVNAFAAVSRT